MATRKLPQRDYIGYTNAHLDRPDDFVQTQNCAGYILENQLDGLDEGLTNASRFHEYLKAGHSPKQTQKGSCLQCI
jgi:hypothetical protein